MARRARSDVQASAAVRLGEFLGVARELRGLTLREVEQLSGVSNALISQIETGKVDDPGFSKVVAIADALGLSVERLATTIRAKTQP